MTPQPEQPQEVSSDRFTEAMLTFYMLVAIGLAILFCLTVGR